MSYSRREQARVERMATRVGITDLREFASKVLGTPHWENLDRGEAADFERKLEAAAVPAAKVRDHVADRVGAALGFTPPAATGRCHYCGLPLNRRGYCEECV